MNRVLITLLTIAAACVVLGGCAGAKSQYVNGERVRGAKLIRDNPDAHDRPILMLKGGLPKEVKIEVVGEVRSNNQFYGGLDRVMEDMAYKARLAGADAVININIKYRMTMLAYAAGSAAGVAVKIIDKGGVDLNALPSATWRMGKWVPPKRDEDVAGADTNDEKTASLIEVKVDRFDNGRTTVSTIAHNSENCMYTPCFYALAKQTDGSFNPFLSFTKVSEGWRYLRCHDVKWLADNQSVEMPKAVRSLSDTVSGGTVIETITQNGVDLATLEIIASAEKTEYRICNDEFVLSDAYKVALLEFINKVKELSK